MFATLSATNQDCPVAVGKISDPTHLNHHIQNSHVLPKRHSLGFSSLADDSYLLSINTLETRYHYANHWIAQHPA